MGPITSACCDSDQKTAKNTLTRKKTPNEAATTTTEPKKTVRRADTYESTKSRK